MTDGLDGAMAERGAADSVRRWKAVPQCVHDEPPSVDFQMPLCVPRAAMVANRVSRTVGWKTIAWQRYEPEPGNVCRPQLTPPSRDTNIPSLPPAACTSRRRGAYVVASNGSTTRQPIRVGIPVASAGARMCQLSPPSMDRKTPSARIGVGRKVGFPGSTVHDGRIGRIEGERADIERRLAVPQRSPVLAAIVALPDAAAGGAGPDDVRLLRGQQTDGHASADVGRAYQLPLGAARQRCERGALASARPAASGRRARGKASGPRLEPASFSSCGWWFAAPACRLDAFSSAGPKDRDRSQAPPAARTAFFALRRAFFRLLDFARTSANRFRSSGRLTEPRLQTGSARRARIAQCPERTEFEGKHGQVADAAACDTL